MPPRIAMSSPILFSQRACAASWRRRRWILERGDCVMRSRRRRHAMRGDEVFVRPVLSSTAQQSFIIAGPTGALSSGFLSALLVGSPSPPKRKRLVTTRRPAGNAEPWKQRLGMTIFVVSFSQRSPFSVSVPIARSAERPEPGATPPWMTTPKSTVSTAPQRAAHRVWLPTRCRHRAPDW